MGTLTKKGIRLHEGTWLTRQAYRSRIQPSSSAHPESHDPQSSTPPSSLDARITSLQQSIHSLLKHVRYLEHGVQMALPEPLREEFKSDRILFDLSDDDGSDNDAPTADDDGSDGASSASDAADSSDDSDDDDGLDDVPEDDTPLIHRFKKSTT